MRKIYSRILILTIVLATLLTSSIPQARALNFSSPTQVPMGTNLSSDPKVRFLDAAPATGTVLKTDPRIKYVDANGNNVWDPGEAVVYDAKNNSIYEPYDSLISGSPTVGASLKTDFKIKFVDVNGQGAWSNGEPVVYDSNGNGLYDAGEPVVGGSPPPLATILLIDSKVKFVDTNGNNVWDPGETVVYDTFGRGYYNATIDQHIKYVDSNSNNVWNNGETVVYDVNNTGTFRTGDPVLNGTGPAVGTTLKIDSKIRFVDSNRNGVWNTGEAVVYDSNNSGLYDSPEPVIVRAIPDPSTPLNTDFRIAFWDTNSNNVWDPGETVVYDVYGKGYYNASVDVHIKFWDSNGNGVWDPSKPVIYDSGNNGVYECGIDTLIAGTAPACGVAISAEKHFRFVDAGRTGRWSSGETVVYDANLDNIYDTGDTIIAGPTPAQGTMLSDPVIAGTVPPVGTKVKFDTKLRFVDAKGTFAWDLADAVVYDTNNNNLYGTGEPVIVGAIPSAGTVLGEPVIAGAKPSFGVALKTDAKIRIVDSNKNIAWDPGEMVVYDSNSDSLYEIGEPVMANGAPGSGAWRQGDPVAYNAESNGLYITGDPMVYGSAPPNGTVLRTDSGIKYVDSDGNGVWSLGETVAYDTNGNGVYDPGEPVIAGSAPSAVIPLYPATAVDPLGRTWLAWEEHPIGTSVNPDIYFKIWNGASWSVKQQATSNAGVNLDSYLVPLSNNTMMMVWSSNRTGHQQLFYRMYTDAVSNPYPTTGPIQLSSTVMSDRTPSAIQDHDGRIWVAWTRQSANGAQSIYYKYDDGTSWSADFQLPAASTPNLQQRSPSLAQTKDGRLWIVFASNDTTNLSLYYTTTDATLSPLPSGGIPVNAWSAKTPLYSSSGNEDDHPSIMQSRDGTLWVFFQSSSLTSEQIFDTSSVNNGVGWSAPVAFSAGTDQSPVAAQMADHRIWVFWQNQGATTEQVFYSTSDQINNIHDVGVRNLSFTPAIIESGDKLYTNVTVVNYGDYPESTTLTLKLNGTAVDTVGLTLNLGQVVGVPFTWQTVMPNWGRYTLTASLTPVTGENTINQGDDTIGVYPVRVSPPGDVNRDGTVNISDLSIIALAYHSTPGSPNWNPNADLNNDGSVGIDDLSTCALYYHKSV